MLNSITIPKELTKIGIGCFDGCSGLESIKVSDDNPIYKSYNNCNAIIETSSKTLIAGCKSTVIPEGIIQIENSAFRGRSGLSSITIPNSTTIIGGYAFEDCKDLTTVVIGFNVDSIGDFAFYGCDNLTDVFCYAEKVPKYHFYLFGSFKQSTTLHVPSSSMGSYISSFLWRVFGTIKPITNDDPKPTRIIKSIADFNDKLHGVYNIGGSRLQFPHKGLNIIKTSDGREKIIIAK